MTTVAAFMTGPDGVKALGIAAAHAGPEEDGQRALRPLIESGPVMNTLATLPYGAALEQMDAMAPFGIGHR